MSRPSEGMFPTIKDMAAVLGKLIADGYGDLPIQLLVAPDSTLQALARGSGASDDAKPALMIEFDGVDGRHPPSIISTERLGRSDKRSAVQ